MTSSLNLPMRFLFKKGKKQFLQTIQCLELFGQVQVRNYDRFTRGIYA